MEGLVGRVLVRTLRFDGVVNAFYLVEKESRTAAVGRRIGRAIVSGGPRAGAEVAGPGAQPRPETLRFVKRFADDGTVDHLVGGG